MKKIIYRTLLINLFIIVIFNIKVLAASDFSYTLDANGEATITAYNGTESNLTIPSQIDGHNVITIGKHAFNETNNSTNGSVIKKLVISEGIEKIELLAFAKCTNLESVELPESLTFIEMSAFLQCEKLKSINIPSKIEQIKSHTFQETGFTEFDIPENIKFIDSRALGICSDLERVRVYSKDVSYDSGVFEHGSPNLVLYGYEGSTTQIFAQQNGINFEVIVSNGEQEETITNDFKLSARTSISGELEFGVYVKKDDGDKLLSIKATDYNLPSNLYDYKDNIRLRITYSKVDYEVRDCKVINYKTGDIIEDVSEENINKLFNVEYGKTIIENSWVDEIKLSTLKENEVYKYTASATVQFPKIKNDVGENCIIYIKDWNDETYDKEVNMYKEILGTTISESFNEYKAGDTFYIMYKKASTEELLKLIEQDKVIYLSKYNDGDALEYQFEEYIYNDTQNDITINFKNTIMGVEETDSTIIEKGQIYRFSWMIDSATISFSGNSNNEEQVEDGKEENGKQETEESGEDNTQATGKLPQTGESIVIFSIVLMALIITVICYKKYCNFNDIK